MSVLKTVRAAKISYIVMSVLFCVLGVVLLVTHEMSVSVLGVLVGAMLIAFGIVKLIGYFSRDLYRLAFQFDLALGILLIVLGTIILLNPTRAMTFLCLMLGIAIMADGLFKLQTALDARRFGLRSWGLILAFALLTGVIGGLLAMGIGDTIRVTLTADPVEEIVAARDILKAVGLRRDGPELIACPTCGRTRIDLIALAKQVEERLKSVEKPITVAVMGCVVNGPGEASAADVGIAGGHGSGLLFRKGEVVGRVPEDRLLDALMALIEDDQAE